MENMPPEEGSGKKKEMLQQQQKFDGEEEEEEEEQESASAVAHKSSDVAHKSSDVAETEELFRFHKSLQELREIRSQLHYAADYCESTFLNSKEKKPIVENTKEYICRAMVTVVDHLGNVSSNLMSQLSQASSFTEAELRMNSLKQRIVSCEQLSNESAFAKVRWSAVLRRNHPRYLLTDAEKPNVVIRNSTEQTSKVKDQDCKLDRGEGLPLFLYTYNTKPVLVKDSGQAEDSKIIPVRDGYSILSKGPNPTFHFQVNHKLCNGRNRRSLHGPADILSLIRRIRQAS